MWKTERMQKYGNINASMLQLIKYCTYISNNEYSLRSTRIYMKNILLCHIKKSKNENRSNRFLPGIDPHLFEKTRKYSHTHDRNLNLKHNILNLYSLIMLYLYKLLIVVSFL